MKLGIGWPRGSGEFHQIDHSSVGEEVSRADMSGILWRKAAKSSQKPNGNLGILGKRGTGEISWRGRLSFGINEFHEVKDMKDIGRDL